MNEFDLNTMVPQVNLFPFVFLEEIKDAKKHFEINWPLEHQTALYLENISLHCAEG